ncbi:MAG: DUF4293 domain-containing protein [Dysgonomonas sp.]
MIQRIQSVYLLLVALLMALAVFLPLIAFKDVSANILELKGLGIFFEAQKAYPTWGIFFVGGIISVLSLINIFLYKNRKKQMRICVINTLLLLFFYVTIAVYAHFGMQALNLTFYSVKFGLALPLLAIIVNTMALVKIKADEKLVKSLDRIR